MRSERVSKTKCILWDVDGTILRFNRELVLARLGGLAGRSPLEVDRLLWESKSMPVILRWDLGELSDADFVSEVRKILNINELCVTDAIVSRAFTNCFELPLKMRKLLYFLRDEGFHQGTLSNTNHLQWLHKLETFPIFRPESGIFSFYGLSFEMGTAKPDFQIFCRTFDMARAVYKKRFKADLKVGECLVIDDRDENLQTAKTLGFDVLLSDTSETNDVDIFSEGLEHRHIPLPLDNYSPAEDAEKRHVLSL